jgi:hypothetical protein
MQEDALPLFSLARLLVFFQLQYQIPLLLLPLGGRSDAALQRGNLSPRLGLFLLPVLQPLLQNKHEGFLVIKNAGDVPELPPAPLASSAPAPAWPASHPAASARLL